MECYDIDGVLDLYKDPLRNLAEITKFLSYITPADGEMYLSIYTSKDQARRRLIIDVGSGRKVSTAAAQNHTPCYQGRL